MSGIEFNSRVGDLAPYPKASTYGFDGELVKLASNESPFGPSPAVAGVLQGGLETLNRYPDPDRTLLRSRIADRTGVPAAKIAIGNGSCELLISAAEVLLEPGAELLYAWPAFSVYPHLGKVSGAREIRVPLDAEQRHDLAAMADEVTVATRLVIVCNPNNPTATALPIAEIDAFVGSLPRNVAVILDEAYVEFSTLQDPADSVDLLDRHPNLIILRTFSKIYGLCGLRVGYALGPESFRDAVDRIRQPFSVNALAQAAAAEAVRHQDELERRIEATVVERVHVTSELEERGLACTDSQANFAWVDLDGSDDVEVTRGLADRGVVVRAGSALGGPGRLRVTFGTRRENDAFLGALDAVLAAK